jgi:hypothetical protein
LPDGVFISQIWEDLAFLEVIWRVFLAYTLFYTLFGVFSGIFTTCLVSYYFLAFFWLFWHILTANVLIKRIQRKKKNTRKNDIFQKQILGSLNFIKK